MKTTVFLCFYQLNVIISYYIVFLMHGKDIDGFRTTYLGWGTYKNAKLSSYLMFL